jgi:hypothetical protein
MYISMALSAVEDDEYGLMFESISFRQFVSALLDIHPIAKAICSQVP